MNTKMDSEKTYMSQPPPYSGPQPPEPGFYPQQPGPPPGFYPAQPAVAVPMHTTTIYPGAVTVVSNVPPMGSQPSPTVCKSCNQQVTTVVKHKATTKTHLFALLLCIIGCWPCVCVPYCMESCRNVDHYCPNCEAYLGSYLG